MPRGSTRARGAEGEHVSFSRANILSSKHSLSRDGVEKSWPTRVLGQRRSNAVMPREREIFIGNLLVRVHLLVDRPCATRFRIPFSSQHGPPLGGVRPFRQKCITQLTSERYVVQIWLRDIPKTGPNETFALHRVVPEASSFRSFRI